MYSKIIKYVLTASGCNKIKSLYYSFKFKGIFIIGPKSKILVNKGAKVNNTGVFYFNTCWNGTSNVPASLIIKNNATLNITDVFKCFEGTNICVEENATLSICSGSINNNSRINCFTDISIGADARISENVVIRDSDNHSLTNPGYTISAPISIGNHVWIGLNSIVLKGVTIENDSVIAAGSVVTKDVKKHTVVGGNPIHIIKNGVTWL